MTSALQREVVFEAEGKVSLRTIDPPVAPSAYNILIRTKLSLISSGTEATLLYNPRWSVAGNRFPILPSAGLTGIIVQIGNAVGSVRPELRIGRRVFVKGHHQSAIQCNVLTDQVYLIPEEMPDEAILLARQALVGLRSLEMARVRLGTSVYIIGLGIIGQLLTRLSVIAGARPVFASDYHENRRSVAASDRIVKVLLPSEEPEADLDIVFTACGSTSAIKRGLSLVAVGGVLVVLGGVIGSVDVDFANQVFRRNVHIMGAHEMGYCAELLDLPVRLISEGSLNLDGLISHYVRPDELPAVYGMLLASKDECLGVVIDWW